MKVLLTAHDLALGGTQTYALTVGEQLQRLGHEVTLHAAEMGDGLEVALDRGLAVARTERELPDELDVVLTQDSMMAYRLAERYPTTPQIFRCPIDLFDLQLPPQLPGIVMALVALSERFARRLRALALPQEVIRLRQPIDTERFAAREAIRDRPKRALLLGDYLHGTRRDLLVKSWEAQGVECVPATSANGLARQPELLIADADIVVAKGKAALEAMSCGRAVYVYDAHGCDGWVTPDSYPAMEADNFAGQATDASPSTERLMADLEAYRPEMGPQNRDLIARNHRARHHVESLVEIMRRLAPRTSEPDAPYRELARMVRLQWQTERRGYQMARENSALHQRLIDVEQDLLAQVDAAERRYRSLTSTRRFRLAAALGRVSDRLRGRA